MPSGQLMEKTYIDIAIVIGYPSAHCNYRRVNTQVPLCEGNPAADAIFVREKGGAVNKRLIFSNRGCGR